MCKVTAPLDIEFQPLPVVFRDYQEAVKAGGNGKKIVIGIERNNGYVSTFEFNAYPDGEKDDENYAICERLVKTLLWVHGGHRVIIAGSNAIGNKIKAAYAKGGIREFDRGFMSRVYETEFSVSSVSIENAPIRKENPIPAGKHTNGCRIGFDAGGSDRKVSAVIDGKTVYDEEIVWYPKINSNPAYQYYGILAAFENAASKMPRVDGIGVSSAGVYVDNKIMVASLFLKVSDEDFDKQVKNMYLDIAERVAPGKPIVVTNDGDVSALAGAMSLNDNGVLGVAMGTSEAVGYVDVDGKITGWLSELAFVPIDFNTDAMIDEWSGDYGCGVKYFSQDAVIKLAPRAGIEIDEKLAPAEKLKVVQRLLKEGDDAQKAAAEKIYQTIGVYFGYAVAYYALFYDIKHVLVLGRVSSGRGGDIVLEFAQNALKTEFPELAKRISISLPDEKFRRVGQSFAAASLPEIV